MKIVYLPLDERPCNADYPREIFSSVENLELLTLPGNLMGEKKSPAPVEAIHEWLRNEIPQAQGVVASVEMILYGGLLPSRLHHLSLEELQNRLARFMETRDLNPHVPLYLSALIMRSPTYNSSDEEPDYYASFGRKLHLLGRLTHKKMAGLDYDKREESRILHSLPYEIREDYQNRRVINKEILSSLIRLAGERKITLLSIPQDDTAPYSFPSMEREELLSLSHWKQAGSIIHNYPGADETGCSLVGRAICDLSGTKKEIYPLYSHGEGLQVIPHFEDRALSETIKNHWNVAGLSVTDSPNESTTYMVYNLPVEETFDAGQIDFQEELKNPPPSVLNVLRLIADIPRNRRIILTDLRFTNGGDRLLLHLLDRERLLDRLDFYSAWNTCGNAIGTACGAVMGGILSRDLLSRRLLEDGAYMACARMAIRSEKFPALEDRSYGAEQKRKNLSKKVKEDMIAIAKREWPQSKWILARDFTVTFPWSRPFEIAIKHAL